MREVRESHSTSDKGEGPRAPAMTEVAKSDQLLYQELSTFRLMYSYTITTDYYMYSFSSDPSCLHGLPTSIDSPIDAAQDRLGEPESA